MRLRNRDYLNTSNIITQLWPFPCFYSYPQHANIFTYQKPGFKQLMVRMGSSFATGCKWKSLYKYYEATQQRWSQYIKYYSRFDHFHSSTHAPKIPTYWSIKTGFQESYDLNGLIHCYWSKLNLCIPIVRLYNRDYLNTSNIIAALTISILLLPNPKSNIIHLSKPGFKPVVIWTGLVVSPCWTITSARSLGWVWVPTYDNYVMNVQQPTISWNAIQFKIVQEKAGNNNVMDVCTLHSGTPLREMPKLGLVHWTARD